MINNLRVLMITSEWPTPDKPWQVPFIVRQVEFLRRSGITVDVLPFRGDKNLLNYFKAWRKAQKAIRDGKYDLIHAQWGQSGLMALPRRVPLVVTFRGDDLEGLTDEKGNLTPLGRVLRGISRMVAAKATEVILVSGSLARHISRRSYHVIPSGLDLDLFCPAPQAEARQRLGLNPETRYVLFAGSVSNPRKRHSLAQEAVAILSREMNVELLTATSVSHKQIPDFMNASDTLLLLSQHEGSPNVVKEALACNLPIVSTDVGDVRERIGSIPGCEILDDIRPEAVAAALRRVIQRGQRLDSRSTVLDLDETVITGKVIEVYHKSLAGHGRVPLSGNIRGNGGRNEF